MRFQFNYYVVGTLGVSRHAKSVFVADSKEAEISRVIRFIDVGEQRGGQTDRGGDLFVD